MAPSLVIIVHFTGPVDIRVSNGGVLSVCYFLGKKL